MRKDSDALPEPTFADATCAPGQSEGLSGALRLYQVTLVLESLGDVQVEPNLWQAINREEAAGLALAAATRRFPQMGLRAHAVTDVTNTVREWVAKHPAPTPPAAPASDQRDESK